MTQQADNNDWIARNDSKSKYDQKRRISFNERRREETLLDWYGHNESGSIEISAKRNNFHDLSYYIPKIVEKFRFKEENLYEQILDRWEDIIPDPRLRQRMRPLKVQDKTLTIEVSDSSTLFHVQRTHQKILERQLRMVMDGKIETVRFHQKGS